MPSKIIGPQQYGISDCPVFVAALWRPGENSPSIRRDEIESITFCHYRKRRNIISESFYSPVSGLEQLALPKACFHDDLIQCPDTFIQTDEIEFPYNFLFLSTETDIIPQIGEYRSRVEIQLIGETSPEILVFDIEVIEKFQAVSVIFGELPRFVGSFYAKQVNDDGTLVVRPPTEVVTDVFRSVKKNGRSIPGQYRTPVEMTLFDPPETSEEVFEASGVMAFSYNFEHEPAINPFPEMGTYDVIFEFFQHEKRIGTTNININVK